jgi:hypothetical protein
LKISSDGTDRVLLEGIKVGISLNKNKEELCNMTEEEIMDYLKKEDYDHANTNYNIYVPHVKPEYPATTVLKTKVMILPLSLEDEVKTCGTANVLKEFAIDLNIQSSKDQEYVVFNTKEKKFNIKAARERYLFYKELDNHDKEMGALRKSFETPRSFEEGGDSDEQENLAGVPNVVIESKFKSKMKQISTKMSQLLHMLNLLVQDKNISDAYSAIKVHNSEWIGLVDGYERNILHLAVEDGNKKLVESLLLAGAPVNSPEGCGVTPLMIAINNNNIDMVQILLWYVCKC